ncbi:MAG: GAF domain-containing protein [Chloroflexi bacterium]|nr:GAF domain-containing protein [Ktedonobacteraceae bacterium]MBV9706249.1 GAF domain-containing protein [Chloroflexota bacterium]
MSAAQHGDSKTETWRDLLGQIIENPHMRQHLARETRVHPVTLTRWAKNESKPREQTIRLLLKALPPDLYKPFISLLSVDFPSFSFTQQDGITPTRTHEMPLEFYVRVLSAHANTPHSLYRWTMYDLILQQAIEHLDPERIGMSVNIVHCVSPLRGSKVRSLREVTGVGTPPWSRDGEQKPIFLGAESLAGAAVTKCRPVCVQSRQESQTSFLVHWLECEQSAAAYPIMHKAKVAGCLLVSCTVPSVFTETHLVALERYAHLMALAFEPEEFFAIEDLELRLMPSYEVQLPLLRTFGPRLSQKFSEIAYAGSPITPVQAEEIIWQEIEEELVQLLQTGS